MAVQVLKLIQQVFTKGVTALSVAIENVGMVLLLSTARSFKCCGNSFVEVHRVFTPSSITMLPTNRSMQTGFNYTTTLATQIFQQQYPSVSVNAKHVTTLSNAVQGVRQLLLEALQHYVNVRAYMEPRDNIGHFLIMCFDPGILMFICFMLYFSLARHAWVFKRATVLQRLQVICELGVHLALLLMHSARVLIRGKHTRLFSSCVLSMGAIQSEFYCCNYLYFSYWFLHFQFSSIYITFAWGSSCSQGMSCCCFRSANGIKKLRVLLPSSFWFCIIPPLYQINKLELCKWGTYNLESASSLFQFLQLGLFANIFLGVVIASLAHITKLLETSMDYCVDFCLQGGGLNIYKNVWSLLTIVDKNATIATVEDLTYNHSCSSFAFSKLLWLYASYADKPSQVCNLRNPLAQQPYTILVLCCSLFGLLLGFLVTPCCSLCGSFLGRLGFIVPAPLPVNGLGGSFHWGCGVWLVLFILEDKDAYKG